MRKIVVVALCLVILPALAAAKCTQEGGGNAPKQPNPPVVQPPAATGKAPDPHAGDPQPSGRQERTITVEVGKIETEFLPAQLTITSTRAYPENISEVLSGSGTGQWTLTFDANSDQDILVYVLVLLPKTGSKKGFCWIHASTGQHDGPRYPDDSKRSLVCYLRIKAKA